MRQKTKRKKSKKINYKGKSIGKIITKTYRNELRTLKNNEVENLIKKEKKYYTYVLSMRGLYTHMHRNLITMHRKCITMHRECIAMYCKCITMYSNMPRATQNMQTCSDSVYGTYNKNACSDSIYGTYNRSTCTDSVYGTYNRNTCSYSIYGTVNFTHVLCTCNMHKVPVTP